MRAFLEQYGKAIFIIVILIIMVLLATPYGRRYLDDMMVKFHEMVGFTKTIGCDHDYSEKSNTPSTCTENGKIIYVCLKCGDTIENKSGKKDHNLVQVEPKTDPANYKEPTCQEDGFVKYKCSDCGLETTITLMKKEHNFKFDKRLNAATETEVGQDRYKCTVCSETDILEISKKPAIEAGTYSYNLMDGEQFSLYLHQNYGILGDIKKIIFTDETAPTSSIIHDVSYVDGVQDGSVVMWVNIANKEMYISTQTSGQKVKADASCEALFCSTVDKMFRNVEEIDVTNLDVSNVKNMSKMFYEVGNESSKVKITGLETWDVSNVTNMSYMFAYLGEVATEFDIGNISGWNTENVKNMDGMFYKVGSRVTYVLDLRSWNVSNVNSYQEFNAAVEDRVLEPTWK